VVHEIEAAGGQARFVAADLNDLASVRALVDEVGPVDVLVNNAGRSCSVPTAELDEPTFNDLFDGNVRAAYFLVAGIAPGMAERSSGSIINVASMAGQIGLAGGAAYGATKGGPELHGSVLGGGIQPARCPGECGGRRAGVQHTREERIHRAAGRNHAARTRSAGGGDRRGDRLPRSDKSSF